MTMVMMMKFRTSTKNKHIRNEQCPECAKLGKDNARDNLAVYSNGKWCFSCGYMESEDRVSTFKRQHNELLSSETPPLVALPEDSSLSYSERAVSWVGQYNLSTIDLLNNGALWSNSLERLIFPIYGNDNQLIAYIGRNFGNEKRPKWKIIGEGKDTYHILGKDNKLILCEDIISAIKLSKVTMAMPLFGVNIGSERFKELYKRLGKAFDVRIWLDPDMRPKALKEARIGNTTGLRTSVIYSNKDPKEHTLKEIKELLK